MTGHHSQPSHTPLLHYRNALHFPHYNVSVAYTQRQSSGTARPPDCTRPPRNAHTSTRTHTVPLPLEHRPRRHPAAAQIAAEPAPRHSPGVMQPGSAGYRRSIQERQLITDVYTGEVSSVEQDSFDVRRCSSNPYTCHIQQTPPSLLCTIIYIHVECNAVHTDVPDTHTVHSEPPPTASTASLTSSYPATSTTHVTYPHPHTAATQPLSIGVAVIARAHSPPATRVC